MWAISPDKPQGLQTLQESEGLEFPLLVDEGSETIEAWGIVNERHGAVPHPTVAVVDQEGVVRFFHLDEDFRLRPPPSVIVGALEGLGGP